MNAQKRIFRNLDGLQGFQIQENEKNLFLFYYMIPLGG